MVIPWRDEQRLEEVFGSGLTSRSSPVFVEPRLTDNIPEYQRLHPDALVMFFDQYIKVVVSEGCRYQCRYCSERLAFPPYHSFPEDEIVTRVHDVVDATGVRDVILIADDLGGYGLDGGSNLVSLIRRIVSSSGVRVALNNMNPADFIVHYNELWELIKSHKICHVNLPIQSASNRVLELMNRTYRLKDIERVFSLFNLYGFRDFDTHVIIGFYGEMKQDFDETVDFIVRHHPRYVLASGFMEPDGFTCQLGAHVPEFVKQRRLRVFARVMEENRIICNVDNGRLSSERFRRMNAV
jgi:tRNA A37 methylthiotransferase MiaB